jgi:ribosomal protein L33
MLRCKNCGGFIYEEEVFYDDNGKKMIQLGCYQCSHKVYVASKKWNEFKDKLAKAAIKNVEKP